VLFFRSKRQEHDAPAEDAVVEVLQRLWQTKRHNIRLLEEWVGETEDSEIKAALPRQIVEERQHLRLIGEQIRALGGRINLTGQSEWLGYAFNIAGRGSSDLSRLVALYRGAKTYSVARCRRLSDEVGKATENVLVQVVLDEERQIRWAELRIGRLSNRDNERDANFILERVHRALESAWERPWRRFTMTANRRKIA
jgi:predicted CopG family antitoxin